MSDSKYEYEYITIIGIKFHWMCIALCPATMKMVYPELEI